MNKNSLVKYLNIIFLFSVTSLIGKAQTINTAPRFIQDAIDHINVNPVTTEAINTIKEDLKKNKILKGKDSRGITLTTYAFNTGSPEIFDLFSMAPDYQSFFNNDIKLTNAINNKKFHMALYLMNKYTITKGVVKNSLTINNYYKKPWDYNKCDYWTLSDTNNVPYVFFTIIENNAWSLANSNKSDNWLYELIINKLIIAASIDNELNKKLIDFIKRNKDFYSTIANLYFSTSYGTIGNLKDFVTLTPFLCAVINKNYDICTLLINDILNINFQDNNQNTVLHYLVNIADDATSDEIKKRKNLIITILQKYLPKLTTNSDYKTPLNIIKNQKNITNNSDINEIKNIFEQYNEFKNNIDAMLMCDTNTYPLDGKIPPLAFDNNKTQSAIKANTILNGGWFSYDKTHSKWAPNSLEKTTSLSSSDSNLKQYLSTASEFTKNLIKNYKGADGNNFLHIAATKNFSQSIPPLLALIDKNSLNNAGETPLIIAAKYNAKDAAATLISNGADCTITVNTSINGTMTPVTAQHFANQPFNYDYTYETKLERPSNGTNKSPSIKTILPIPFSAQNGELISLFK